MSSAVAGAAAADRSYDDIRTTWKESPLRAEWKFAKSTLHAQYGGKSHASCCKSGYEWYTLGVTRVYGDKLTSLYNRAQADNRQAYRTSLSEKKCEGCTAGYYGTGLTKKGDSPELDAIDTVWQKVKADPSYQAYKEAKSALRA